jgi:hypothetical protein
MTLDPFKPYLYGAAAVAVAGSYVWAYHMGASSVRTADIIAQAKGVATNTVQIVKAADTKDADNEQLTTFLRSAPVRAVFLQHGPVVQTPASACTGAGAPGPVGEPVHGGDSGSGAGEQSVDVGKVFRAYAAVFEHSNGDLREQQAVK